MFANSSAPTAFFLPGFLFLALSAAFPPTVLAAVLERPFVSRAGVRKNAIWYSLQSNLVSALIGICCMPFAFALELLWPIMAVTISVLSEGKYYERRALEHGQALKWGWITVGNILSSAVLFAIGPIVINLEYFHPNLSDRLAASVRPYHAYVLWTSLTASLLAFAWSFVVTSRARRHAKFAEPSPALPSVTMEHVAQDPVRTRDRSGAAAP